MLFHFAFYNVAAEAHAATLTIFEGVLSKFIAFLVFISYFFSSCVWREDMCLCCKFSLICLKHSFSLEYLFITCSAILLSSVLLSCLARPHFYWTSFQLYRQNFLTQSSTHGNLNSWSFRTKTIYEWSKVQVRTFFKMDNGHFPNGHWSRGNDTCKIKAGQGQKK